MRNFQKITDEIIKVIDEEAQELKDILKESGE